MRLLVDIEGNNLLAKITRIHCIVTKDLDTGEVRRFRAHAPAGSGETFDDALALLSAADELIAHNGLDFDFRALAKVLRWQVSPHTKLTDTLVISRLIWAHLAEMDSKARRAFGKNTGSHALEFWGRRLGILKGKFGKTTEDEDSEAIWAEWTQEMEDYCAQDVEVLHAFWKLIEKKAYSPTALQLEHEFKALILQQEDHGFRFDCPAAEKLTAQLQITRATLTEELQKVFPPEIETLKTPAYWGCVFSNAERYEAPTKGALEKIVRGRGYKFDAYKERLKPGPMKTKEHPFNPGSRLQIADRLIKLYNWKPTKFTDSGQAEISETVLSQLSWPEAKLLTKYLGISKLLGQLAEGDNAWLKLQVNGRLHGRLNTNGAVTGRCTHNKPNIAQVPSVMVGKDASGKKAPVLGLEGGFGWESRGLYLADEGYVLVGWDASGLELRCLAHFLHRFDGGKFGDILLTGDVHTSNQEAAGFFLRDSAKTFIYAYLYGAGDEKLGKIAVQDAHLAGKPRPAGTLKKIGSDLRARFEKNFPALGRLKDAIKATLKTRNYLVGLDGRHLHVRSAHSALNTLLQSAGALLMKKALVFQMGALVEQGLRPWRSFSAPYDFGLCANIHDEVQATTLPELAEVVGKSGPAALKRSGEFFSFKCPLDGEFKVGRNWGETH
jgi:DNA polymerase I